VISDNLKDENKLKIKNREIDKPNLFSKAFHYFNNKNSVYIIFIHKIRRQYFFRLKFVFSGHWTEIIVFDKSNILHKLFDNNSYFKMLKQNVNVSNIFLENLSVSFNC